MDAIAHRSSGFVPRPAVSGVAVPVPAPSPAESTTLRPLNAPLAAAVRAEAPARTELQNNEKRAQVAAQSSPSPVELSVAQARVSLGLTNASEAEEQADADNTVASAESEQKATDSEAQEQVAAQEAEQLRREVQELSERDREVRAHELAHAVAGGRYTGTPSYEFKRGPDGKSYAVNGEVSIDVSPAATPQATIDKMQTVRRAALAPAEPSSQDRRVAAEASRIEAEARQELIQQSQEESGTANSPVQGLNLSVSRSLASEVESSVDNTNDLAAVPVDDGRAQRVAELYSENRSSVERQVSTPLLDSLA